MAYQVLGLGTQVLGHSLGLVTSALELGLRSQILVNITGYKQVTTHYTVRR